MLVVIRLLGVKEFSIKALQCKVEKCEFARKRVMQNLATTTTTTTTTVIFIRFIFTYHYQLLQVIMMNSATSLPC